MKLVPGVRALTVGCSMLVLQVTLNLVPKLLSNVSWICELAVTAVVSTTTVVPAAATTTEPLAAEPQTAGEAALEQFVAVM